MAVAREKRQKDRGQPVAWQPIATDGGWGWVVVFGSFLIHVFADGIVYSFGIMVSELLDAFGEGRAKTSWVVSLLVGLTLGTGPVASAITNRYGCRVTTMAGSLVATAGCLMSYFATSVFYLMLTVGLVMGLGFGLMYCPAIVIVTMYFEEKRAFATGIAVCGAGIGTFIFSPLSAWLIDMYTWRGAFLIYAGIVLNCAVCGALFRPLVFRPIYADEYEMQPIEQSTDAAVRTRASTNDSMELRPVERVGLLEAKGVIPAKTEWSQKQLTMPNGAKVDIEAVGSDHDLKSDNNASQPDPNIRAAFSHSHVNEIRPSPRYRTSSIQNRSASQENGGRKRNETLTESTGYLKIKDVFYSGSVTHIPEFVAHHDTYRSITSLGSPHIGSVSRVDGRTEVVVTPIPQQTEQSRWADALSVIKSMVDMTLLIDPIFLIFAVSNFLTSIGFNAPLVFLPDRAEIQLGISRDKASWILSSFGIANTIGRVCVGFVCDREWPCIWGKDTARNRLYVYSISVTICGACTMLSFLCTDLFSLIVYSAVFGFTLSSYVCLTSVLLVDLLGLERLTNAFGLLLLFQGLATLVGPPIAGEIVDRTNNYDFSFLFAGVGLMISGLMLFFIPLIRKHSKKRPQLTSSAHQSGNFHH